MSVLTGATAAALYGSQGANGVILITTKKGQEGRVRVNYANNTTFSSPLVMPEFQNTYGTSSDAPSMRWGEKLVSPPIVMTPKIFSRPGLMKRTRLASPLVPSVIRLIFRPLL